MCCRGWCVESVLVGSGLCVCVFQEDVCDGMYFKEENVEDNPREIQVSVCKLSVVPSILQADVNSALFL